MIKGGGADLKRVKVKGMAYKPMKRRPRAEARRSCSGVFVCGVMFGVSRETICNSVALIDERATELHLRFRGSM